jgi:hypothetical protein
MTSKFIENLVEIIVDKAFPQDNDNSGKAQNINEKAEQEFVK